MARDPRYVIRRLWPADARQVLQFLLALDEQSVDWFHPHEFDLEHVDRLLTNRLNGLVDAYGAFDGDRLCGYAWLWGMEGERPSLGICVAADLRGNGIGRALMDRVIDEATCRRKQDIRLTVVPSNERAIRLYQSCGFEFTDAKPGVGHKYMGMRLKLPSDPAGRAAAIRRRLEGARIHVVPYTHCDWAWVHTRHWHEERYAQVYRDVLQVIRERPDYRWYMDNVACQLAPYLDRATGDELVELRQRVAEGAVAICGGYSNVRPNMVGDETFVRSLVLGRRDFRGHFPEADLSVHADAVDVASGHPQLPQLLRQAGYSRLRIWRPHSAMSLKGIPTDFRWTGLDGSQVVVARGCYGGLWALTEEQECLRGPSEVDADTWLCTLWDAELEERLRYSATGTAWMAIGCDDVRPNRLIDDTPFDLPGLVDRWNGAEQAPMAFATPPEVFNELERRTDLPAWEGALDLCDVAYNAGWNGEKGLGVQRIVNDRLLLQAEMWRALAGCGETAELEALWRDHLLTCAHATQWLYTEDFAELKRMADHVGLAAARLSDEARDRVGAAAATPGRSGWVVASPNPWPSEVDVELTLSRYGDTWPIRLVTDEGIEIPTQTVHSHSGQGGYEEHRVVARVPCPGLGVRVIYEEPVATSASGAGSGADAPSHFPEFHNGRLWLTMNDGRITAVVDAQDETAWDAPIGLEWGGLVLKRVDVRNGPLHVGKVTRESPCIWEEGELLEHGPIRWRYRRTGHIGYIPVQMDTIMARGQARIDFEVTVDWPGFDGFLAARFPMLEGARMWGDIPFAVEPREPWIEPYCRDHWVGANSMERCRDGLFVSRSFTAVEGHEGESYALVAGNTDRYYTRHPGGRYLEHLLINSVVSMDDWEKNVEPSTLTGRGEHLFRFSALFYRGGWRRADLVRRAAEVVAAPPPRPLRPSRAVGPAPGTLTIEPAGVRLSSLAAQGDQVLLRVVETHGVQTDAAIRSPWPIARAVAVDFEGRPVDLAVQAAGAMLRVRLEPWQIATLQITPDRT